MKYLKLAEVSIDIKRIYGISEATFRRIISNDPDFPRYRIGKRYKYVLADVINYMEKTQ